MDGMKVESVDLKLRLKPWKTFFLKIRAFFSKVGEATVGCDGGCTAIVDTGSSLMVFFFFKINIGGRSLKRFSSSLPM